MVSVNNLNQKASEVNLSKTAEEYTLPQNYALNENVRSTIQSNEEKQRSSHLIKLISNMSEAIKRHPDINTLSSNTENASISKQSSLSLIVVHDTYDAKRLIYSLANPLFHAAFRKFPQEKQSDPNMMEKISGSSKKEIEKFIKKLPSDFHGHFVVKNTSIGFGAKQMLNVFAVNGDGETLARLTLARQHDYVQPWADQVGTLTGKDGKNGSKYAEKHN